MYLLLQNILSPQNIETESQGYKYSAEQQRRIPKTWMRNYGLPNITDLQHGMNWPELLVA